MTLDMEYPRGKLSYKVRAKETTTRVNAISLRRYTGKKSCGTADPCTGWIYSCAAITLTLEGSQNVVK